MQDPPAQIEVNIPIRGGTGAAKNQLTPSVAITSDNICHIKWAGSEKSRTGQISCFSTPYGLANQSVDEGVQRVYECRRRRCALRPTQSNVQRRRFAPADHWPPGKEINGQPIDTPVVASYLPTALLEVLAIVTNRLPPDIAMLSRNDSEEMKRLLMGAPVVASYLPIVSLPFTTNR